MENRQEKIARMVREEFDKFGCVNVPAVCGRLNRNGGIRYSMAEVEDFLEGDGFVKRSQFVWMPRE